MTERADEAHNSAWQLTVKQLSPSSKTLTIYHKPLTGLSAHAEARDKAKLSYYFHSLPNVS